MKASIYTLTIGTETHFCRYCDEVREYEFISACNSCRFKKSEAVKASRKIIRAFKKAGDPIVKVWDGGDYITGNERELLEAVHSVDTSYLHTESGAHVLIVAGNESEADCVCDWSTSIDSIMRTVNLLEERED